MGRSRSRVAGRRSVRQARDAVPRQHRVAHYCAGRLAEAVHYSQEILRLRPRFQGAQRMYCASLAQAGRVEEARKFLGTVR
ncbi:MAG: tetratricopeptide repeat protein [Bradyrhizobium sp.]